MAPPASASSFPDASSSRSPQASDLMKAKLATLLQDLELDTGDVVLFDRKCTHMNLYGGAICACAKWFGETQWDHNGVVIRDPDNQELFLLEATLSGVKMRPLLERLLRSSSYDVVVRKLQVNRTPEFHQQAMHFVKQVLTNAYEDRVRLMFNAGVPVPSRMEREKLFNEMIQFKKQLQTIENELQHRSQMASFFERKALLDERQQVEAKYRQIASVLNQTDRSLFENELHKPLDADRTFCSQLVARLYQHLGILLPYPSTNSYLPKHFSSQEEHKYLKLQQEAVLLKEISLRKDLEANYAKFRQRQIDMRSLAPNEKQKQQIVECLRRHPLFHMLEEKELYEIAGHFHPRVLQPGEVVFFQGMKGEYFYFIEKGECDVFVDYDLASQMQNEAAREPLPAKTGKDKATGNDGNEDADNAQAQAALLLKRRQTLQLPEFQESSRIMSRNAPVLVATNCAGSAFGDSALMYGTPRRATIRATIPHHAKNNNNKQGAAFSNAENDDKHEVVVWRLDKKHFRSVVKNHPESQHSLEERHFLLEAISNHPLFANLDQRSKALAVRKCFPLYYPKGSVVMNQGDPGEYFYVIESGQCVITRKKPNQDEQVDRVIGKGRTFGEATLLYNSRRGASVKVVEDAKLWCMDRPSFLTITRSGSTSLVKLFNKLSHESSISPQEKPVEPPGSPPKATHAIASAVEDALAADAAYSADSWDTYASKQAIDDMLKNNSRLLAFQSKQAFERAQALVDTLLFHDDSGLINFSQFVHFHMALSPTNANQLVAEAMFRILQKTKRELQNGEQPTSESRVMADKKGTGERFESSCGVQLCELIPVIRAWAKKNGVELQSSTRNSEDMLELYKDWFGMQPNHLLTYDDLLHVVMTLVQLMDKYKRVDYFGELGEFEDIIKRDTRVLRQLWMAVEVNVDSLQAKTGLSFEDHPAFQVRRPSQSARFGMLQQQLEQKREQAMRRAAELSFDSNLKTGWISALRYASHEEPSAVSGLFGGPKHPNHPRSALHPQHKHGDGWLPHVPLGSMGAALGAGMVSRTCVAPLERLKILMQLPDPINGRSPYSSASKGLSSMVRNSGFRGLFAGNLCHCVVGIPSLPMKFLFCEVLRDLLNAPNTVNRQLNLSSEMKNFFSGGCAGVMSHAVLYPLSVVRGRLTTQQYLSDTKTYNGIIDCFRVMRAREGLGALYRGFGVSSLGAFTYIGWNLSIYEFLRPMLVLYDTEGSALGHPSIPGQLLCSATACVASQFAAYPLDLMRRRLQIQGDWHHEVKFPKYSSVWNCAMEAMKDSPYRFKVLGLYRGVLVNSFKAVPAAMISFLTYEKIREVKLE